MEEHERIWHENVFISLLLGAYNCEMNVVRYVVQVWTGSSLTHWHQPVRMDASSILSSQKYGFHGAAKLIGIPYAWQRKLEFFLSFRHADHYPGCEIVSLDRKSWLRIRKKPILSSRHANIPRSENRVTAHKKWRQNFVLVRSMHPIFLAKFLTKEVAANSQTIIIKSLESMLTASN